MNETQKIKLTDLTNKKFSEMNEEERKAAIQLGLVVTDSSGEQHVRTSNPETVRTAYWIHEKVPYEHSVTGYIYSRQCTCSNCGYHANLEKPVCPSCHAVMVSHPVGSGDPDQPDSSSDKSAEK